MATDIQKLYRQQWRRDLVLRCIEIIVALGAWALLSWALVSAFGTGR